MNLFEKRRLLITFLLHLRVYYVATTTCEKHQFQCDDGECIAITRLCNGRLDCSDESDETKCSSENYPKCTKHYFQCVSDRSCIPFQWRCNDKSDCDDGSDEDNCPKRPCTEFAEFECLRNRQCVNQSMRCNGKIDCDDASDELNCHPVRYACTNIHFACEEDHIYMCISRQWLCDGENDCDDGSDEKICATTEPPCPDNYCKQNARCVVINGQYHCNCSSPFTGEKCEMRITGEQPYFQDLGTVIGISMALIFLFIITSLMIFCYYKRRTAGNSTALVSTNESQIPFTSFQ